jgi:hypothetical protein
MVQMKLMQFRPLSPLIALPTISIMIPMLDSDRAGFGISKYTTLNALFASAKNYLYLHVTSVLWLTLRRGGSTYRALALTATTTSKAFIVFG